MRVGARAASVGSSVWGATLPTDGGQGVSPLRDGIVFKKGALAYSPASLMIYGRDLADDQWL